MTNRPTKALRLSESTYPAVQYIPRDVDPKLLLESTTTTYCPYKGDADSADRAVVTVSSW